MIPISVLEGFAFGVATTIGLGQMSPALGQYGIPKHKNFYANVIESFENLDKMQYKEFMPFLFFFTILFTLMKKFPGKPWIILIAILGIIYSFISLAFFKPHAPVTMKDIFPTMSKSTQLLDLNYWQFAD